MRISNRVKVACVLFALVSACSTIRANPSAYMANVEGYITTYEIQGAPDLGIQVGDRFTGTLWYWGGHADPAHSLFLYDHFLASIHVNGIEFHNGPDGHASYFGGDMGGGEGSGILVAPNADYGLYFSGRLSTFGVFNPPYAFNDFEFTASGPPNLLSPSGSSLQIKGRFDLSRVAVAMPDPAHTAALLVLALAMLATINKSKPSGLHCHRR